MKTEKFYEKYGTKTMLIAHFIPVVRSFAPVTAGAGRMDYKQFVILTLLGTWSGPQVSLCWVILWARVFRIQNYVGANSTNNHPCYAASRPSTMP